MVDTCVLDMSAVDVRVADECVLCTCLWLMCV